MVRALQVTRRPADDGTEPGGAAAASTEPGDARVAFVDLPEAELGDGDVLVDVRFSSLNFKDGLALRGDRGVARVDPLVPGIDLAGVVVASGSADWRPGDEVVVTGCGLGETRNGGYAERARVPAEFLVRVPEVFGTRRAAAIGTAGFTAALAVLELERHGLPDGEVLVSGASGGVGSLAVHLLARAGREVAAVTGSPEAHGFLRDLGATRIVDRAELADPGRPLQSTRWAGAVDTVGGAPLVNVLAQVHYGGAVAACGLVGAADLPATVLPFILRGVALLGINSVETPLPRRREVWDRLARDLDPAVLDGLTTSIPLDGAPEAGRRILTGAVRGRTVVDVHA